jgi:Ca2+-binding RTX toxin-like protein
MALYELFRDAPSMFTANATLTSATLLYWSSTEFGFLNGDGTTTYFHGTNIDIDESTGRFVSGTLTGVKHFDVDGNFVDAISNANVDFSGGLVSLTINFTREWFLRGDDTLSARVRLNNAIVDDTLDGSFGNDTAYGGTGNDTLIGNSGGDALYGDAGNDILLGDNATGTRSNLDTNYSDKLFGGSGTDFMYGGMANDALSGGSGTDTAIFGGTFASLGVTRTASGLTVASLFDGTDTLATVERIAADDGTWQWSSTSNRWVKVNSVAGQTLLGPNQTEIGTAGDDTITINDSSKTIVNGLAGNDTIQLLYNLSENQLVFGGDGNDNIMAIGPNARAYGGAGDDTVFASGLASGGIGNDTVSGKVIFGDVGNDLLTGFNSTMTGGAGLDTFQFNVRYDNIRGVAIYSGFGDNIITDFSVGTDTLLLNAFSGSRIDSTVTDTAAGIRIDSQIVNLATGGTSAASVLLKGLHGTYTLDDFIL